MDVYCFRASERDLPFGDEWLSADERVRLHGLRIPKRRADWRLGRWTAKCAICAYLHLPVSLETLTGVEVRPAPSGAPEAFLYDHLAPVALSLSHSRGVGWCAIAPAGAAVGCDIERIEPRSPAFVEDYFTAEERRLVAQIPAALRDRAVTLLWSAKESALKALHCGLRADTRAVNATPAELLQPPDDAWRRLIVAHASGRRFSGWWRGSEDFVWTMVADPPGERWAELPADRACHFEALVNQPLSLSHSSTRSR